MDGIIAIAIISAVAIAVIAGRSNQQGLEGIEDDLVSAENIRMGVSRGWYTATLLYINGVPCVRVTGKATDESNVTDVFRISQEDFDSLKNEGYPVE